MKATQEKISDVQQHFGKFILCSDHISNRIACATGHLTHSFDLYRHVMHVTDCLISSGMFTVVPVTALEESDDGRSAVCRTILVLSRVLIESHPPECFQREWSWRYTHMYDIGTTFAITLGALTHWGRNKMASIFPAILANAFFWTKMYKFR